MFTSQQPPIFRLEYSTNDKASNSGSCNAQFPHRAFNLVKSMHLFAAPDFYNAYLLQCRLYIELVCTLLPKVHRHWQSIIVGLFLEINHSLKKNRVIPKLLLQWAWETKTSLGSYLAQMEIKSVRCIVELVFTVTLEHQQVSYLFN